MKTLKLAFVVLVILTFTGPAKAQGYVFSTYEDFVNKKYVPADSSQFIFNSSTDRVITLRNSGEWKNIDIWGFVWRGELYRRIHLKGQHTLEVMAVGSFVLYKFPDSQPSSNGVTDYFHYYVSRDLNSPAHRLDKRHLPGIADEEPAFKELAEYVNKADEKKSTNDIVYEYIMQTKGLRAIKDLLPAVK